MTAISTTRNMTYVRTVADEKSFSGSSWSTNMLDAYELDALTVQADKALKLIVYTNYYSPSSAWGGLYFGMSIKVGDTWYDCGDSGYSAGAMADYSGGRQSYTHTRYVDLIKDGIVPAGAEYTIQIMLLAKAYSGTGYVNSVGNNVNGDDMGNHGVELTEVMAQNHTSVIIQEKDRWL